MKRYTALLLVTAALTAAGTAAHAEILDDINARKALICGVLGNLEPFGYQDPTAREVVGYEIDLCRALADSLGVKAELKVVSSQARIPELMQGRLDVLAALISYSPERAEQVAFSNSYVTDTFRAIVDKDAGYTKLDDLANERISVIKGSFLEPLTQKRFPDSKVLSFEDASAAFTALEQGRVAATIQRTTQARALQLKLGEDDNTVMMDEPLVKQKSGFATRRDNPLFVAKMNEFLLNYEKSGEAEKLYAKWIGDGSKFKLKREFTVGEDIAN